MSELEVELDRLVLLAVEQIQAAVRPLEAEKRIISYHEDYPSLDRFKSGQPQVRHARGPIDYSSIFRLGDPGRWHASFDDVPAFQELADLALKDDRLRSRLFLPGAGEMNEIRKRMLLIGAAGIPLEIFDRLRAVVGPAFSGEDFEATWQPMRNGLLWEKLPLQLVIPVCLTTFDVEEPAELDDGTRIEPLPDDEQRARVPKTIFFGAANDCVVAAATHAVCIDGFDFEGDQRWVARYDRPEFYPLSDIERVFQALRIATPAPIGYAQIYMRPLGWAWDYKADLPPIVQGSIARRYPPHLDDYGWLRKAAVVTTEEVRRAGKVLRYLRDADRRQRLASRRFSSAALREEEEDAILDLCIALEAAVGDRQRGEMTYKLSLRTAALMSLEEPASETSATVMRRVKQLYNWRSKIVHGDEDIEKAREKFIGGGDTRAALPTAVSLLRRTLLQLVFHPEFGEVERIDAEVLLGEHL